METTDYRLPDGRIVAVDSTVAKGLAVIGFTLEGGRVVDAVRVTPAPAMVRHRFTVWIEVPAVSGDGWNKYPDYSAEEIGRAIRRALHESCEFEAVVEHGETAPVEAKS